MTERSLKDILNSQLPQYILKLPHSNNEESVHYIRNVLTKTLPNSDNKDLTSDLKWKFLLEKHSFEKSKKSLKKKKTFLTRKQRHSLNLLKLPKKGWQYNELENLRLMWRQYMEKNLSLVNNAPSCTDPDWTAFSAIIAKSELVGAELLVVRSKVPSLVRQSGTIVLETKMTFQIITPDSKLKTLLKDGSVFQFHLGKLKFVVFGKYLSTKPTERSVRKIKLAMVPDL